MFLDRLFVLQGHFVVLVSPDQSLNDIARLQVKFLVIEVGRVLLVLIRVLVINLAVAN